METLVEKGNNMQGEELQYLVKHYLQTDIWDKFYVEQLRIKHKMKNLRKRKDKYFQKL
jgi:hypothetical protein